MQIRALEDKLVIDSKIQRDRLVERACVFSRSHMTVTHLQLSSPFLLSTTIIINAYATIGINDTTNNNNMNTTGLNPAANDLLQAISGGGLSALEAVTASSDAFPPLKAAAVRALAIIGIVKVCVLTSIILSCLYATTLEIQYQQERLGCFFGQSH